MSFQPKFNWLVVVLRRPDHHLSPPSRSYVFVVHSFIILLLSYSHALVGGAESSTNSPTSSSSLLPASTTTPTSSFTSLSSSSPSTTMKTFRYVVVAHDDGIVHEQQQQQRHRHPQIYAFNVLTPLLFVISGALCCLLLCSYCVYRYCYTRTETQNDSPIDAQSGDMNITAPCTRMRTMSNQYLADSRSFHDMTSAASVSGDDIRRASTYTIRTTCRNVFALPNAHHLVVKRPIDDLPPGYFQHLASIEAAQQRNGKTATSYNIGNYYARYPEDNADEDPPPPSYESLGIDQLLGTFSSSSSSTTTTTSATKDNNSSSETKIDFID